MKKRVLIPLVIITVIIIYGYGIRIAEPIPVATSDSNVGEMSLTKITVWELDDAHKIWLHSHGFSIIKLDQTKMPPEFAQFEMTARFAGVLPYRITLECPVMNTSDNPEPQSTKRDCFGVLFS